ncbi:putative origin recognition complex, subunit 5, P-loop containing nucleoside triphosphate hydrolase [Rosa chinensis]|uniref:Putative origin recognition complex, subunit 5, P-loop containing nucleoside triphosphate hydrolase n=1 Tax=Rosa chinensis TaxID=74649 RepID=A0A2P6SHG8_ROSCH|nr:origin of replication complex subunit 5 [Rosa chinensis]XP_024183399.1 origin of replication complex subunit 5 [Rosa chinensis]XP_024183406.1 origin of replication complex subunit 5 [Rosa chinensis]XP_040369005.1 origin of replication complex subunit 5 [Rosa chinensis]XP_040369006.1 origin of replication complex subunit 5 [Rosa chinensis]XP_040369007.1 origin of replication complex subunit 5 [Rosa chinensis]PRQ58132.1 putative origin recognition complex, subunit 5, P-loop containing nucleo
MVKEERPQITRRATRSSALAKSVVEETDTSSQHPNDTTLSSDMVEEESPQITRRTTRSSALAKCSNNVVEETKANSQQQLTLDDLVIGEEGESFSFTDLVSSFPGRDSQIKELVHLLGPQNSPMLPIFIYGGSSTGKTSIVLQTFRHLKRPIVYLSCLTCYNPRILFESILNQLFLHQKNAENGYSSAKRCEKPSDFVNFLHEALVSIIGNPQGQKSGLSSKRSGKASGNMIYLIFDNLERVKGWDKGSTVLPLLFNLYDTLKKPEVGLIFISNNSPDTYDSNMGYVEPNPLYLPDYTDDDLGQILMRNQANKKLYTSFLSVVLRPFSRITRRVDELSSAFSLLFRKYCEPVTDLGVVPNEEMKRKLFSQFQPHIAPALNEIFKVSTQPSTEVEARERKPKGSTRKSGGYEVVDQLDFHMSTSAKYLLISAFLASRNPATLDASLFDSTGGSNNRKRKRKVSEKSMEQKETAEQELLMKGPGTFAMERLLAIFQCITSVAEDPLDDEEQAQDGLGIQDGHCGLMSDVLLQLTSLCGANFIVKGGSCPLEGSTRYRSTVSEDMALQVARSIKFPLSKYLYRR